ncbi:MAG: 6-phosphogluconolactonase [Anaerolineae bacterium]|nr:6-phosphogluconolactonase [Anaerolineae bacterium]
MDASPEIHTAFDAADLAWDVSAALIRIAQEAIQARGVCHLALSGGSTPIPAYALLALPEWRARLDWSKVQVYWGDERCVPPDHPQSNYLNAKTSLLDPVKIPPTNVHRIKGELPPAEAAQDYEREIAGITFDLILLGMGDDGHTASLFPGTPILLEQSRRVAEVYVPHLDSWRVSLTLSTLNSARTVMFMVSGATKADRIQEILKNEGGANARPAGLVRPTRLIWMLDREAAGRL